MKKMFPCFLTLFLFSNFLLPNVALTKEGDPFKCPTVYTTSEAPVGCPGPREKTPEEDYKYEESYEYEEYKLNEYRRLYYSFGVGGSGFVKKNGLNFKGMFGILTNIEYRFSRLLSAGFDSYYGYLMGNGNQYLSIFNPGIKIFPMMYKNPKFQPFIFLGGHAFDAVFGDSQYNQVAYAQGGFAGAGFRLSFSGMMGLQTFARASFLYMTNPPGVGGRSLVIPVYGFLGVYY